MNLNVICCKLLYIFKQICRASKTKLLVIMLMMNWINNLASVHHFMSASPLSISKTFYDMGQSLSGKYENFPGGSSLRRDIINPNVCVRSGVRTFQAPFCAYATVINETPGISSCFQVDVFVFYVYGSSSSSWDVLFFQFHVRHVLETSSTRPLALCESSGHSPALFSHGLTQKLY